MLVVNVLLSFLKVLHNTKIFQWSLVTLINQTYHTLGVTPQKFLRWPLHPSQELHRCFGLWFTIWYNSRGQLPLTIRLANHPPFSAMHPAELQFQCKDKNVNNCLYSLFSFLGHCQKKLKGYPHDYLCPWAPRVHAAELTPNSLGALKQSEQKKWCDRGPK